MEWTAEQLDRLYELYQQHIERLRADVIKSNRSLGSRNPEKTALKCLGRHEFQTIIKQRSEESEVVQLWIRRIVRGHEREFPQLSAFDLLSTALPANRQKRRRKTGS